MGGADFAEGEDSIDYGLEASGEDVAKDFVQLAHGPHVGAEQRELAREQMAEVDADNGAGGGSACHESAGVLEGLEAFVPCGGADVLDYDIHAFFIRDLADFVGDFLSVVVDAVIGA